MAALDASSRGGGGVTAQPLLIPKTRECVCCHRSATPLKRQPGEPNVMAVSLTIYRKGNGKGQLKAAPKVNICEECFVRALAPAMFGVSREGKSLLLGIRESLSGCYSALVEDDAA